MTASLRFALFAYVLAACASAACMSSPAFDLANDSTPLRDASRDDGDGGGPAFVAETDAATDDAADETAPSEDASTPPPPPPPPPKDPCPAGPGRVCCGDVACVGCSSPNGGECRDCQKACAPGQLCCRKGGKPKCRAANASCGED